MTYTRGTIRGFIFLASVVLLFSVGTQSVFSKIGVGMGAGEIRVTEDIKPGGIYSLPNLRIFNTGDETTTYGMNVAYHQDYQQIRPAKDWFTFEPPTFTLAPGESQEIRVMMTVPVKTEQGEYFAFLESGPVATHESGTSVGVAVASKLYFTVVPANLWQAITHRVEAFMATYAPWSWIVLNGVIGIVCVLMFARFFSLNISLRKKSES